MRNSYLRIKKHWDLVTVHSDTFSLPRNWVRVKLKTVGVCGGDVKNLAQGLDLPFCHEYFGKIIESTSHNVPEGINVAGYNCLPCASCTSCLASRARECPQKWFLTLPAAAEYIDVPSFAVYPTELMPEKGVLIEPTAAVISNFNCLDRDLSQIQLAVVGRGPIALIAKRWLQNNCIRESKNPDCIWLYSESLLERAIELVNVKGQILICYSPNELCIPFTPLKKSRNRLVSFRTIVASPNEFFRSAELFLGEYLKDVTELIGKTAPLFSPKEVVQSIIDNRVQEKKTIIYPERS